MISSSTLARIERDSVSNELTPNDICSMFNEFLNKFQQLKDQDDTTTATLLDAKEQIADAVKLMTPSKLLHPQVIAHPIMHFMRQTLIDMLSVWQSSELRLSIQESDIFLKMTSTFVCALENSTAPDPDEDRQKIRNILASQEMLTLVSEQIIDTAQNQQGMNDDPNICALGLLTITFLRDCPFFDSPEQNLTLIDTLILNCLDSYDYNQTLAQYTKGQPPNVTDRFLLFTCWNYIPFVGLVSQSLNSNETLMDSAQKFYDDLLSRFEQTLDQFDTMTPEALAYIFARCKQLLDINNLQSFDKHASIIVNCLTKILKNPELTKSANNKHLPVVLEAFYHFSQRPDMCTILKKHRLVPLIKPYTSSGIDTIRKSAFGILAEIVNEREIKNNPTEMISIFTDQLKQYDPNADNSDLDQTLSGINALMQHEQTKAAFIEKGGLELLTQFICNTDPNKQIDKNIEEAFNILLSCTFNNPESLGLLKSDRKLIERVNDICEKSKECESSTLTKTAEYLLWKLDKEDKFMEEQAAEAEKKKTERKRKAKETGVEEEEEEEEQKYDCMVSYSWADMDLAHRIFKHLTQNLGYKIWLDQEQMHGSTIQAMANAVDGAEFILMCMSETYKRSANCRSEAEYAFNRKKQIVPLKMKKDYVPDGWLGFILGSRMYIDFGTYEFDKAIELLVNEIELQRKKKKDAKEAAKMEKEAAAAQIEKEKENEAELQRLETGIFSTKSVEGWSKEKVKEFLRKHNFLSMAILCDGMTGKELANLYNMCCGNPVLMYRSLGYELAHGCNRILPISTFVRFMNELRVICESDSLLDT